MITYLLAATLVCDPALTALFTPARPAVGRYEVCITEDTLDEVLATTGTRFADAELLEPLDAFGAAGSYNRSAVTRLYGGKRVRVARGWRRTEGGIVSVTVLSPHPDATLTRLLPGTMIITWTSP
jgi:hypothetical protein